MIIEFLVLSVFPFLGLYAYFYDEDQDALIFGELKIRTGKSTGSDF